MASKCNLCKKEMQNNIEFYNIEHYLEGSINFPKFKIKSNSLKKMFFKKHGGTISYCKNHSNMEMMQDLIQNHQKDIDKELIRKYSKAICQKDLNNIIINIF